MTANMDERAVEMGDEARGVPAIEAMRDRQEVDDLITKLGRWLDAGEFDLPHDLMAADVAVSTPGGRAEGIEAVVAQAGRNHGAFRTQHVITDRLIEFDGDRATAAANLTVAFAPLGEAGGEGFAMGERYAFEARRAAPGWRLTRIEVVPLWRTPMRWCRSDRRDGASAFPR